MDAQVGQARETMGNRNIQIAFHFPLKEGNKYLLLRKRSLFEEKARTKKRKLCNCASIAVKC